MNRCQGGCCLRLWAGRMTSNSRFAGFPPEEERIIDLRYGPAESSELTDRDI